MSALVGFGNEATGVAGQRPRAGAQEGCHPIIINCYVSDRPSLPQPPVGGPGSPELALDDLEARSTLPGAACSMSQEPYDLTQQVSQPTTVPKNNFQPGEKR